MQTRKLGNTELELTRIGFGAWAIGGGNWAFGWGAQDDNDSIAAIQRALDLGINWIDTAAVYGLGRSESVCGQAIKGRRDSVIVATKCSMVWNENRKISFSLKGESVKKECEDSLRRLGVDVIDLYQIHWPRDEYNMESGWEAIQELIAEGKVRYAGVSNFSVEQMKRCQQIAPIASLQPPYNMLTRQIEDEILPFCAEQNIGVAAYSPMKSGLLTGKWTKERTQQLKDDFRKEAREFNSPFLEINLELVEKLRPVAAGYGVSVGELAIAWTLARPEVTASIVGARRPDQVDGVIKAADIQLSADHMRQIKLWLDEADQTKRQL